MMRLVERHILDVPLYVQYDKKLNGNGKCGPPRVLIKSCTVACLPYLKAARLLRSKLA